MYRIFKRLFDFVSALLLLIAISPLFIILMIMVRVKLGKPIFFKQERVTKNQRTFSIIKFRTMTDARDENGHLLPDEKRMTAFGGFLRSTSLDELPELLNIIKGDMSVIGPRPLPPTYNSFYTESEKKRFKARGGLIPPDAVADSALISWDKQLAYEAAYAEEPTLKKDLIIFLKVFKILFIRKNIDYGEIIRESLDVERSNKNI